MKVLGENIDKINETVKELGIEVATYAKLLDAAQKRLEKAREQKEQFVDKKHRLLNKKQKLMQSDLIARGSTSKPGPVMQVRSAVAEVAELDSVMEALSPYPSHSHSILTSSPLPLHENQLPALPLPLGLLAPGKVFFLLVAAWLLGIGCARAHAFWYSLYGMQPWPVLKILGSCK